MESVKIKSNILNATIKGNRKNMAKDVDKSRNHTARDTHSDPISLIGLGSWLDIEESLSW